MEYTKESKLTIIDLSKIKIDKNIKVPGKVTNTSKDYISANNVKELINSMKEGDSFFLPTNSIYNQNITRRIHTIVDEIDKVIITRTMENKGMLGLRIWLVK